MKVGVQIVFRSSDVIQKIEHAKELGFDHPVTGEYMEFSSELPESFQDALRKIKK